MGVLDPAVWELQLTHDLARDVEDRFDIIIEDVHLVSVLVPTLIWTVGMQVTC
jgi:hypothetical protein